MASESKNSRKPLVGIIMGSDTDLPVMSEAAKMLEKFEVPYEIEVTSAHRSPARTHEYASTAVSRGLKVVIVAAGGAAHLAGVVAAITTLPVVAVPMAIVTETRIPDKITGAASGRSTSRSCCHGDMPSPSAASRTARGSPSKPVIAFSTIGRRP